MVLFAQWGTAKHGDAGVPKTLSLALAAAAAQACLPTRGRSNTNTTPMIPTLLELHTMLFLLGTDFNEAVMPRKEILKAFRRIRDAGPPLAPTLDEVRVDRPWSGAVFLLASQVLTRLTHCQVLSGGSATRHVNEDVRRRVAISYAMMCMWGNFHLPRADGVAGYVVPAAAANGVSRAIGPPGQVAPRGFNLSAEVLLGSGNGHWLPSVQGVPQEQVLMDIAKGVRHFYKPYEFTSKVLASVRQLVRAPLCLAPWRSESLKQELSNSISCRTIHLFLLRR